MDAAMAINGQTPTLGLVIIQKSDVLKTATTNNPDNAGHETAKH